MPVTIGVSSPSRLKWTTRLSSRARVVGVDLLVLGVVGRDREAEQPALADVLVDAGELLDDDGLAAVLGHAQDAPGRALAHEQVAVGEERQAPRDLQPGGHDLGLAELGRGRARTSAGWVDVVAGWRVRRRSVGVVVAPAAPDERERGGGEEQREGPPHYRIDDAVDAVVARARRAVAVAVARAEPQRPPAGRADHGADPPVATLEDRGGRPRARAVQRDLPQPLPAQRADVERAADDGVTAGRGLRRAPGDERIGVPAALRVAVALDVGPAVVVALLDEVDLVLGVLAELRRPQAARAVPAQALHVAVAVATRPASRRGCRPGPTRRGSRGGSCR